MALHLSFRPFASNSTSLIPLQFHLSSGHHLNSFHRRQWLLARCLVSFHPPSLLLRWFEVRDALLRCHLSFSQCFLEFFGGTIAFAVLLWKFTWFCSLIKQLMSFRSASCSWSPRFFVKLKTIQSELTRYAQRLLSFCRA